MNGKVVFRKLAQKEMLQAIDWYEQQKPGLGLEFTGRIEESLNLISNHPEMFAQVLGPIRKKSLKPFPYAIYYRIRGESIVILAIFHQKRAPKDWQSRT